MWLLHLTFGLVPNNPSEILQYLSMTHTMLNLLSQIYPKAIQMVGHITLIPGPDVSSPTLGKTPLEITGSFFWGKTANTFR